MTPPEIKTRPSTLPPPNYVEEAGKPLEESLKESMKRYFGLFGHSRSKMKILIEKLPGGAKLGGSVYGHESVCNPPLELSFGAMRVIDTNRDGKFTAGIDKILDSQGKPLNLRSKQVGEVLKDLNVATLAQLKNLSAAAGYLAMARGIRNEIEKGNQVGDASYLFEMKGYAFEAGIPFGTSEQSKMEGLLAQANEKGAKVIAELAHSAVESGDFSEAYRETQRMKNFVLDAAIDPSVSKPMLDRAFDELKNLALEKAEDAVKRSDLTTAANFLDEAKRCADETGHPVEPEKAEIVLIPAYFEKIWGSASRGEVSLTEDWVDSLRREASFYGVDPLTFEYCIPRAMDSACRNAAENSFKKAEAELAGPAPNLAVVQASLEDAKKFSIQGHAKFDEERAGKISGKAWLFRAHQYSRSALGSADKAANSLMKGDIFGAWGASQEANIDLMMSSTSFGVGVLKLLGL